MFVLLRRFGSYILGYLAGDNLFWTERLRFKYFATHVLSLRVNTGIFPLDTIQRKVKDGTVETEY